MGLGRLVPQSLQPLARRLYRWWVHPAPRQRLSSAQLADLPGLKCIVSYNEYGAYCIPLSSLHRVAARRVLGNDVYEPLTLAFMRAHCGSGDIVHAGTYFGDFLPALSSGVAAGAMVWAFEPNQENYRCARVTCELNDASNVTLTHAGLGEQASTLHVQTVDGEGHALGGASHLVAEGTTVGLQEIAVVTIDDVVGEARAVSIIQLDVEGHEEAALRGALRTIRRCHPIIIVEVLPESSLLESDWFQEQILGLGYRKTGDLHANMVFEAGASRS
ncbi:MAG: FkbM family methyltransferase [Pseudomonadota bacterium]